MLHKVHWFKIIINLISLKNITMKNINLIVSLLLIIFVASCSPMKYDGVDPNGIPLISDVSDAVTVTVDQESNNVTFTLNKTGCNPIWIFADGSYSTINGVKKLFAKAGDYTIEVKVSNRNGISDGSITKTFHLNKTLVDEAVVKKLCGGLGTSTKEWVWNSKLAAHFGCGPSGSDGLSWWSAAANEKKDWGMYDDIFTFGANNKYTYDPGVGGTIYVNKDVTLPEFNAANPHTGADYMAPVSVLNTSWELSYEGENLYITFPKGALLGYLPNAEAYNNPKFKIWSLSDNKLVLSVDNGGIAWHYEFIPKALFDSSGGDTFDEGTDLASSKYAEGIVAKWTWEPTTKGHFGCGDSPENPTGWWSANPNDKKDWGLYDDTMTFGSNGSYVFNPGEGGQLYVNKGCTFHSEYYKNDDQDYLVPVTEQTATYTITQEAGQYYIVLPAHTMFTYMPSDEVYNTPKFRITRMTTTMVECVSVGAGISWKYRFKKMK